VLEGDKGVTASVTVSRFRWLPWNSSTAGTAATTTAARRATNRPQPLGLVIRRGRVAAGPASARTGAYGGPSGGARTGSSGSSTRPTGSSIGASAEGDQSAPSSAGAHSGSGLAASSAGAASSTAGGGRHATGPAAEPSAPSTWACTAAASSRQVPQRSSGASAMAVAMMSSSLAGSSGRCSRTDGGASARYAQSRAASSSRGTRSRCSGTRRGRSRALHVRAAVDRVAGDLLGGDVVDRTEEVTRQSATTSVC
jgi:hypothetical protein